MPCIAMRIGYVVPRYLPHAGGVETHVAALAQHMPELGHTVEVLTPELNLAHSTVDTIDGVTVRRFPCRARSWRYAYAPGLLRYLRQHASEYDLIHAQNYHALPALQATYVARPLVFTPHYHGTGHTTSGRVLHVPYRILGRRVFHRAGRIICVSSYEARLVVQNFPEVAERITVIPNGVHAAPIRSARPFELDYTVILSVGRLLAYKRVDRIIRALAHLDERFRLVIIGDGPQGLALQELASQVGVAERVRFLGRIAEADLHRWYRSASVGVSMSEEEAYGLTLVEAAIAGASIVASDIPAHREVTSLLGDQSRLVPADISPVELASVLDIASRGTPGRTYTAPILDWSQVARLTADVYSEVLSRQAVGTLSP